MTKASRLESATPIAPGHDVAWPLLPWHANGNLQGGEMDMVEQHLQACPACREAFIVQKRLSSTWWLFRVAYWKHLKAGNDRPRGGCLPQDDGGVVTGENGSRQCQTKLNGWTSVIFGGLSSDQRALLELTYQHGFGYREIAGVMGCSDEAVKSRMFDSQTIIKPLLPKLIAVIEEEYLNISSKSFGRLMSKIGCEIKGDREAPAKSRHMAMAGWLAYFQAFITPPRLTAALASGLLALALPFLLQEPEGETKQVYHTVADAGSLGQFSHNDIQVIFADQVTRQQAADTIKSLRGRIVNGPTGLGIYTIRVADGEGTVAGVLERLRNNSAVIFAEPALP